MDKNFEIYFGYFNPSDYVKILLQLNTEIYKLHTQNADILDSNYLSAFE